MDVLLQAPLKLFHILEFVQIEILRFESSKEALHGSVIQKITPARHALRQASRGKLAYV